ncbi:MAG: hypothetical protein INF65_16890 [Roseomonas sp.]|jgi:hypothetical protein|nr:hypothetical protein [Roseomonas sp.]MCA3393949.1 hypothetical protein [Roseomonas sp.]MCA3409031.1 hypothetical protein [Roseomonas sp.]
MGGFMNMPLEDWNGASATRRLEATIKALHEENIRQSSEAAKRDRQILLLTRWTAALTVLMAIFAAVQIYLAFLAIPAGMLR